MASRLNSGVNNTSSSPAFFSQNPAAAYYSQYMQMEAATAAQVHPSQQMQQAQPQQQPAALHHQQTQPHPQSQPQQTHNHQQQQSPAMATPEPVKRKRGRPRLNITDEERAERAKQQQAAWRKEYKRRRMEKETQTRVRHETQQQQQSQPHLQPQQQQQHGLLYARGTQSPFFSPSSSTTTRGGDRGTNGNTTPFINTFNGMSVGANGSFSTPVNRNGNLHAQSSLSSSHGQGSQHNGHQGSSADHDASTAESLPLWQDVDVDLPVPGDLVVRTEMAEFTWHGKVPGRLKVVFIPDEEEAAALAASSSNGAVGGGGKPSPSSWRSVNNSD